jgi:hypothetical protein
VERTRFEAVLAHCRDDVVFTSPVAIRVLGGDAIIEDKDSLRYRNQKGGLVTEVLTFGDDGPISLGRGTYLAGAGQLTDSNPAGVRPA